MAPRDIAHLRCSWTNTHAVTARRQSTCRQDPVAARARARRSIGRLILAVAACWIAVTPGVTAQQGGTGWTERVVARTTRDVNGKDSIDEKVVTRSLRTKDRDEVVIEIYLPSLQADRLTLSRRIRRVTTSRDEEVRTVEECEERPLGAPNEPLRIVERHVTIIRKQGADTYVSERKEFALDANGRLVPREVDGARLTSQ